MGRVYAVWTLRERLARTARAARASAMIADGDREARDAVIEQASMEGMSVRDIARDAGLPASTVQQIVLRRTAARQDELARRARLGGPPVGPTGYTATK